MQQPDDSQQPEAAPDKIGLVCIDGDNTLIDGHTHNRIHSACVLSKIIEANGGNDAKVDDIVKIIKAKTLLERLRYQSTKEWQDLFLVLMQNNMWKTIRTNEDTQWELVKNMPPVGGDPERWQALFLTLIDENYAVAMVSFSSYGEHILPRYLHEVIGLEKAYIAEHICVVSSLPEDQSTKEKHISSAQEQTGTTNLPAKKIVLCDDDPEVVRITCHNGGYIPVYADEEGNHIHELFELCESLKNPNSLSTQRSRSPSPWRSARTPSPVSSVNDSPARTHMRRSSSQDCGLQNSGEYNNTLQNSAERVTII